MRIFTTLVLVAACGAGKPPATDTRPLFVRLGGQPAINAVVHEFVLATKADNVCSITGGGCTYKGKTMTAAARERRSDRGVSRHADRGRRSLIVRGRTVVRETADTHAPSPRNHGGWSWPAECSVGEA
jgi:hypothetical protein